MVGCVDCVVIMMAIQVMTQDRHSHCHALAGSNKVPGVKTQQN